MVSLVSNAGGTLSGFSVPLFLGMVIDAIGEGDKEKINQTCLAMLVVILIAGVSGAFSSYWFNLMSSRILRNMAYDLFLACVN